MSAFACCVDSAVTPPPYALASCDSTLSAPPVPNTPTWSALHSSLLYRVDGWGAPYFTVNSTGNISVRPHGLKNIAHQEIDLLKVVKKVTDPKSSGGLGLQLPLVVRFPDVLKNRLESLQSSFDYAIQSQGYESHYQGVFPVKCNQDKFVVEDIVNFGSGFRFGLEAGSKPELLLAMSCLCNGSPDALLVCNGFKDIEYISLALVAQKLHLNAIIVLEQEDELDTVIIASKKLGISPVIGLRAKLRTKHSGHFGSTSGEKGKFGLTTTQILRVVKKLQQHEMLDCLQLIHFHIGSQIPDTALLSDAVGEATHIYCELVRLGACMKVIDIGGGLGIDYDGSKSVDSDISVGYTLQQYACAVVEAVRVVCDSKNVKHPIICSESGRAIVSHHSILVFEAISANNARSPQISLLELQHFLDNLTDDCRPDYENISAAAFRGEFDKCLVHAEQLKQRCVDQFKEGSLGMEELAAADGLCELLSKAIGISDPVTTYNVNLSIFTSIPDFWAIGQLFPIIPIHKLNEKPSVRGILSDLTCDSDGKINKFIGGESSLPLHEFEGNTSGSGSYYLGMFLGGAYEEALGGLHNLFGGPSVVRIRQSDGPQCFAVTRAVPGPSCSDVLRVMQYEPQLMFQTLKHRLEEYSNNTDDDETTEIGNGIACCFNKMPYLTSADSCSLTAAAGACVGNTNNNNNSSGYYYLSDDGGEEEQQWPSYCVV